MESRRARPCFPSPTCLCSAPTDRHNIDEPLSSRFPSARAATGGVPWRRPFTFVPGGAIDAVLPANEKLSVISLTALNTPDLNAAVLAICNTEALALLGGGDYGGEEEYFRDNGTDVFIFC